jgi:putative ABC transport system permease protein
MTLDPNERRIRDEIEHHLAELEARLETEGYTREEARAEATRRFGDPTRVEREARSVRARPRRWREALDGLRQDLVFAARQFRRQPLVSGLTIATLVIGVAATAVVFSVVHAVVLSPLPFHDPDGLVHVSQTSPQGREYSISEPNFVDFRARQRSFVEMAGIGFGNPILTGDGEAEAVEAMRVSHTFFSLLGITPIAGRTFRPEEDVYGGPKEVVLISEGAWLRRYGGDRTVVGRTLILDGAAHRIVGIVPSDRAWPGVEIFTPLAPNPDDYRDDQRLESIARLASDMPLAEARSDMSSIAAQLSAEYPDSNDGWGAQVKPVRDWLVGSRLTQLAGLLLGAVGLFLLMGCASVSNLLLARATTRLEEMSLRAALGAGRGRIVRQLFTEGALLAFIGAALAVLLAGGVLRIVQTLGPADVARLNEATVGGPVLAVATAAAVFSVLAAGLAPAVLLMGRDAFGALRSGSRGSSEPSPRVRSSLVVAQFALALTVVLSASLLTRSFVRLQEVELGFEPERLVRFGVRLPDDRFDADSRLDFLRLLEAEIEAIPGVEAMGATHAAPYSRWRPSNFVARSDREPDRQEDFLPVSWRGVTDGYFEAAGIELLAGRVFGPEDRPRRGDQVANPPVIIDETLAALLFPDGEGPIGRLVTWFLPGGRQCEIIGVVAAARDERMDIRPRPRIYRPFAYTGWYEPSVIVRIAGDPADLIPPLRAAVLQVDPSVPAIGTDLVERDVRASVAWPRFSMQVLTVFGAIALALASMGIYGVTAFSVTRRRREIGVRVALGAEPSGVVWLVIRRAMRLAAVGIAAGTILSLLVGRFLESLLYDVSATDPTSYLGAPLLLALVAAASACIPARRVLSADPSRALASE